MPRLIHVNGPSGVGKSSVARKFVSGSPGTLLVDPDLLLASIGGWEERFWELIPVARNLAVALAEAHLERGHDVVIAQLCTSLDEVRPFEHVAERTRSDYLEAHLECSVDTLLARFRASRIDSTDLVRAAVYRVIAGSGGEDLIEKIGSDFERYQRLRPNAVRLRGDLSIDSVTASLAGHLDDDRQIS